MRGHTFSIHEINEIKQRHYDYNSRIDYEITNLAKNAEESDGCRETASIVVSILRNLGCKLGTYIFDLTNRKFWSSTLRFCNSSGGMRKVVGESD